MVKVPPEREIAFSDSEVEVEGVGGNGQQVGVLRDASPAWRDMWRSGSEGRECRVRNVVRKR